jgi:hypothetical protein
MKAIVYWNCVLYWFLIPHLKSLNTKTCIQQDLDASSMAVVLSPARRVRRISLRELLTIALELHE